MKTSIRIVIGVIAAVVLVSGLVGSFNKGKTSADSNSAAATAVSTASATSQPTAAKADASVGENVWVYQPQVGMQAGQPVYTRHYLLFTTHPCNSDWMVNSRGDHVGSDWKFAVYVMDSTAKPDFTNPLIGGCWYSEEVPAVGAQLKPTQILVYDFMLEATPAPDGFDADRLFFGPAKNTQNDRTLFAANENKFGKHAIPKYIKDCDMREEHFVCAPHVTEADVRSLNVKLGFTTPTPKTEQTVAQVKPAPAAKVSADVAEDPVAACATKKMAAFRKEAGVDALVTADMANEWEGDCKTQLGK